MVALVAWVEIGAAVVVRLVNWLRKALSKPPPRSLEERLLCQARKPMGRPAPYVPLA
jgi:hypothetical protein